MMLRDAAGISAMTEAPWLLAPAAAIVLTVLAMQLADGRAGAIEPVRH